MRPMRADFLFGLAIIVLAIAYLMVGQSIPTPQMVDPLGPRVFPAIIGVGLLGAGMLLCFEARSGRDDGVPGPDAPAHPLLHWKSLVGMLVWTVVYYLCFVRLGYLLATICYVFGLLCVFHRGRHLVNALIAAGFSSLIYIVFTAFLGVDMPHGVLPF